MKKLLFLFLLIIPPIHVISMQPESNAFYNENITNQAYTAQPEKKFALKIENFKKILQDIQKNDSSGNDDSETETILNSEIEQEIDLLEKKLFKGLKKENIEQVADAVTAYKKLKKINFEKNKKSFEISYFNKLFYFALYYNCNLTFIEKLLENITEFSKPLSYPLEFSVENSGVNPIVIIIRNATIKQALDFYYLFAAYKEQIIKKNNNKNLSITCTDELPDFSQEEYEIIKKSISDYESNFLGRTIFNCLGSCFQKKQNRPSIMIHKTDTIYREFDFEYISQNQNLYEILISCLTEKTDSN